MYFSLLRTQVITEYKSNQVDTVVDCLERMTAHLTGENEGRKGRHG